MNFDKTNSLPVEVALEEVAWSIAIYWSYTSVHLPCQYVCTQDERSKFDACSGPCTFLGFMSVWEIYRFYIITCYKILIIGKASFYEFQTPMTNSLELILHSIFDIPLCKVKLRNSEDSTVQTDEQCVETPVSENTSNVEITKKRGAPPSTRKFTRIR